MSGSGPSVELTPIPGLLLVSLPVHGDNRGWFKENWQREKLVALGLPDFGPVQNNVSFNAAIGTTRGIHAEPWDKYVSVAAGRVFAAWVDLREGPGFGRVFHRELGPETAVFVPRGVGNAFQTLAPDTVYSYLVNDHWSAEALADYVYLNAGDGTAAIPWPIPLDEAERSAKDLAHPRLADVQPMRPKPVLVLGADGQLGRALRAALPEGEFRGRTSFDLTAGSSYDALDWGRYGAVINAAAYTDVDGAETPAGRRLAWQVNAAAVSRLAAAANRHRMPLVQVSSDYVFDGAGGPHTEDEAPSPLSIYGQSKAAGDVAAAAAAQHYVLRTSWVIGQGKNFVRTMARLASQGASPAVVNDQCGRLTFAQDLAAGIAYLLRSGAPFGIYNLTGSGPATSWADVAAEVYRLLGCDPGRVRPVPSAQYYADRTAATRPANSVLDLSKLEATGFRTPDAFTSLAQYLQHDPGVRTLLDSAVIR